MKNKLLLDTNIVIYILQQMKNLLEFLAGIELFISFMTELEVLSFSKINSDEVVQIYTYLQNVKVIEYNNYIKQEVIKLRRKYNTKIADTIILATANMLGIPLLTADKTLGKTSEDVEVLLINVTKL